MKSDKALLGELCSLITDGKHGDCQNEVDSGYYFISCKDVRDGRIHYKNARQITRSDFAETHRRTDLTAGDVVLTNSGTIGRLAVAPKDDKTTRTTFQKSVAVLKPIREKITSKYLYYCLASERTRLINSAGGAAQKNLLLGELRRFAISVPSIEIQNRIGEVLSAYDDLIENNRRRIELLELSARLLYKEWFVHLRFPGHEHTTIKNGIPDGWERVPLSEMCVDIRDQVNPQELDAETPYIGLEHIPRRSITLGEWGRAADVSSSKFRYQESDILFGKIRPCFHKVGIALTGGITSSDAIVIRSSPLLNRNYLLCLLSSDLFVQLASKTVREGSKMPRADWKFLLKSNFLNPAGS